jgi:hypothetical protein
MSKRILVVEDQPDIRQIIRDMLDSVIRRPREPLRLHRRSRWRRLDRLLREWLIIGDPPFGLLSQ